MALRARKGHAVIGRDDDQRILLPPALRQRLEQCADLRIERLDGDGVVEHVTADGAVVRPDGGDTIDVGELFAGGEAGAGRVGAVWILAAVPEAEGLILVPGRQEVTEAG